MITELDKLKRAKDYMQMLSNRIEPISGETLPADTALNNERLSCCFSYVAEVLQKVIDNGGKGMGGNARFLFRPMRLNAWR